MKKKSGELYIYPNATIETTYVKYIVLYWQEG